MQTTDYFFIGRKKIGEFSFSEKKGKIQFNIKAFEQWDNIYFRDIACGEKISKKFEKKVGVNKETKENIESIVKGKLGLKGLVSLESQIKGQISTSFSFHQSITKTETSEIEAPQCGRRIIDIWQKSRFFYIEILDSRFFSSNKGRNLHCICEHLEFYHDNGKSTDFDPACSCEDKYPTPEDGMFEIIIDGKVIVVSSYRKLKNGNILIENFFHEVSTTELGQMFIGEYKLNSSILPRYISFLGGLKKEAIIKIRNHNVHSHEFDNELKKDKEAMYIFEKTSRLMEKSQKQAEEMRTQEEEMRQNLEELKATQEEASRRKREILKLEKELIKHLKTLKENYLKKN
jgi:hypothetical protein